MDEAKRLADMLSVSSTISDSPEIRETCALLEQCDLFIGNDTGAAHLAASDELPDHRYLATSAKWRSGASQ